jgi:hypothetical protein
MFKHFLLVLMMVGLVFSAGAGEVAGRIYTGPGGSYTPQAGEVVKELQDAKLEVTRPDKSTFIVDLSEQKPMEQVVVEKKPTTYVSPPPAYQTNGQTFVYRNGQRVGDGSTIYVDPRDQVVLRQQDLREQESRHEAKIDWSRELKDFQQNQQQETQREADRQWQQQRDQQRAKENMRRDAVQAGQRFGQQVQSVRQDLGDRFERYVRSQN